MRVKDLPEGDRPRERLLADGAEVLSDRELLALLLGSGSAGCDAVELAGQIINRHGGLHELSRLDAQELVGLPGMGPAKAARVAAAFQLARRAEPQAKSRVRTSADLAAVTGPLLCGLRRERVAVVVCDPAGSVLRTVKLTEGAADQNLLPVRDVLSTVLASGGASFGVAHNHPSGNPEPSEADRRVTTRLREAADTVGLTFLDHLIITDTGWRRVTTDR